MGRWDKVNQERKAFNAARRERHARMDNERLNGMFAAMAQQSQRITEQIALFRQENNHLGHLSDGEICARLPRQQRGHHGHTQS